MSEPGALNAQSGRDASGHAVSLSGDESIVLPEFDDPPPDPVALLPAWFESADALWGA